MHRTISELLAGFAVVTATAAPALACGGGGLFTSSCSPCGQAYVNQAYFNPCSQGYLGYGFYHQSGYHNVAAYERLPSAQYFYADQGPTFTGPGLLAPIPTYQESAVSGWGAYRRSYYYGYDGGRYANATTHDYDGAPVVGPAVYSYQSYPRFRPIHRRIGYYGHGPRSEFSERFRYRYALHHHMHYGMYHFAGPHHYGHPVQLMRRDD
jgi:hypothetical protein